MAMFTVRVELFKASEPKYEALHTAMEKAGFSCTVKAGDGKVYHLPTAEYSLIGKSKVSEVLALAKKAAATTRKTFAIFVSEAVRRRWIGLPVVKK
jgi:hypothetical protein